MMEENKPKRLSVEDILKHSKELYAEIREYMQSEHLNDGEFIELCLAIAKWEDMDYHLESAREERYREKI